MTKQIKHITGIDLSPFSNLFVEKTINVRMAEAKCTSIEQYADYIKSSSTETGKLKKALNNNFSEFFRNTLSFAFLEHHILPALAAQKIKKPNREIRIWSAACAAGQEPYSIAMLCDEFMEKHKTGISFRIFATDISEPEIQNAKQGVYTEEALKNVSFGRVKNYFTPKGNRFVVNQQLKDYIDFSTFDLLSGQYNCPPVSIFGNFDIVFCANLLFYYKPNVQKRILQKVDSSMARGGWLIVGDAEKETAENKTGYISYKLLPVLQKPG